MVIHDLDDWGDENVWTPANDLQLLDFMDFHLYVGFRENHNEIARGDFKFVVNPDL